MCKGPVGLGAKRTLTRLSILSLSCNLIRMCKGSERGEKLQMMSAKSEVVVQLFFLRPIVGSNNYSLIASHLIASSPLSPSLLRASLQ